MEVHENYIGPKHCVKNGFIFDWKINFKIWCSFLVTTKYLIDNQYLFNGSLIRSLLIDTYGLDY